jgi:hypothetical protein
MSRVIMIPWTFYHDNIIIVSWKRYHVTVISLSYHDSVAIFPLDTSGTDIELERSLHSTYHKTDISFLFNIILTLPLPLCTYIYAYLIPFLCFICMNMPYKKMQWSKCKHIKLILVGKYKQLCIRRRKCVSERIYQ